MLYCPGSNSPSVPKDEPGKLVLDGLLPSITILNCEGRIGFCSHVTGSVWQPTFLITVSVYVPIIGGGVSGVDVDDDNILCSLLLLLYTWKETPCQNQIFVHHCQSLHLLFVFERLNQIKIQAMRQYLYHFLWGWCCHNLIV